MGHTAIDPADLPLPLPLPDEVDRHRLRDRLRLRWQHPVTVLQAGAGFGKSTLLAQAVRDNAVEPCGIDVWYGCVPGDENADQLGRGLLAVLDVDAQQPNRVETIGAALARYSPIDVSLILDDAHLVVAGSSGARLLTALVRQLPANAHLVIAGRTVSAGSLARLRAADRILQIDERDLMFTDDEVRQISARFDRCPTSVGGLGGWPALVRLALAAQPDVAFAFVREEILHRLSTGQRRAVFALANLGYAEPALVHSVVGGAVDLEVLAQTVPLISRTRGGLFSAHELWSTAASGALDPADTADLRAQVIEHLVASGQLARAGSVAMAHDDVDQLARVALHTVSRTVSVLPVDTVRPWLEILSRTRPELAETWLLGAAWRSTLDFGDPSIDDDIDRAATSFRRRGDALGEAAALAVGTVGAHSRGQLPRIAELSQQAAAIPDAQTHPVVTLVVHATAAVVAEMSGQPERALAELRATEPERVPPGLAVAVYRFWMHCLLVTGEADEAAEIARRVPATGGTVPGQLAELARWHAGSPGELLALGGPALDEPGLTSRDTFVRTPAVALVLACLGRRDDLTRLVAGLGSYEPGPAVDNARDAVLSAVTRAFAAVADHDDTAAAELIAQVLADHQDSPVVEQHLRRFLPVGYVLNPTLRRGWDRAALGPSHRRWRTVCRLLVDLRAGRPVRSAEVEPEQAFSTLPLPWSVELACRLHAAGHPGGGKLAALLVDQVAEETLPELRRLAGGSSRTVSLPVARAAASLLAHLPAVPSQALEISVLGPLRIRSGGVEVSSQLLGRARVRSLLALLVVHRSVTRDRATDLLWPELDAADGARNLRVTLTYLRQLLEPDRQRGEAPFHVRSDGSCVWLHASTHLRVDLWELQRHCAPTAYPHQAASPQPAGDTIASLETAVGLWRGDPLADLTGLEDSEPEIERTRLLQLGALLELGECRLARGQAGESLLAAERALILDPYSERAHRLALSAALHGGDRARVQLVARRLVAAHDELGIVPAAATRILLRQVPRRPARLLSA